MRRLRNGEARRALFLQGSMLQVPEGRTPELLEEVSSAKKRVTSAEETNLTPTTSVNSITSVGPKVLICTIVNGKEVRCLADSGSQVTILPIKLFSSNDLLRLQPTRIQFQAYNGSAVGKLSVDLKFDSLSHP